MGDTAEAGVRPTGQEGSPHAGPATPTVDELMRERDSLRQSVQGLARERDEWKVKAEAAPSAPPSDTGEEEWLTPKTARSVIREELTAWNKEQQVAYDAQVAVERERATWLSKAATEVPESLDKSSPVYKKAQELFNDPKEGLSRAVNGQLLPSYPNTEYVAFLRAKSLVGTTVASVADARAGAQFASAGGPSGGGAGAGGAGEMPDEEYLKLSPEERARYQDRKFLEKHGYAP